MVINVKKEKNIFGTGSYNARKTVVNLEQLDREVKCDISGHSAHIKTVIRRTMKEPD